MASERVPPPPTVIPTVENVQRGEQPESPQAGPLRAVDDNPFGSREGIMRLPSSRNNSANDDHDPVSNNHASVDEKYEYEENVRGLPELPRHAVVPNVPSPNARYGVDPRTGMRRQRTGDTMGRVSMRPYSAIDYLVPPVEVKIQQADIKHRLEPTIRIAKEEKAKYELKAKWTGYTLNAAIGLQVLLGSLTTGLSAAATSGRSAAIQTTILGGLSTIVASYLARARGTNEPEKSNAMVKDLAHFIRECEAFEMDHGHVVGNDMDAVLLDKRRQLEILLGHTSGNGSAQAHVVVPSIASSKVETSKTSPV